MMLGKRQRPPMKRTTSMSEITLDLNAPVTEVDPNNTHHPFKAPSSGTGTGTGTEIDPSSWWWKQQQPVVVLPVAQPQHHHHAPPPLPIGLDQSRVLATVSPRNHRKQYSADLDHTTADFLRSCSLCKRRLVPGRDIYMYKGDSAFCSLECRQQQMNKDERKDKCCVASKKQAVVAPHPHPPSGSQVAT